MKCSNDETKSKKKKLLQDSTHHYEYLIKFKEDNLFNCIERGSKMMLMTLTSSPTSAFDKFVYEAKLTRAQ